MRHPLRKAAWFFLAAAVGTGAAAALFAQEEPPGVAWFILVGGPAFLAIPVGLVWGLIALLAAFGEARLRRGVGRLAGWDVPAAEWEAFRALDTARGAEGPGLVGEYVPRPAEGRSVPVMFGRRQVVVDDHYSPLRRFAVPELTWVNWLSRPGEPECLEFGLLSTSETSSLRTALRVPVPAAAREAAVAVYHHFARAVPRPREGLAFRRPGLVIGGAAGVAAAGLAVAGAGWLLAPAIGDEEAAMLLVAAGLATAIAATFVAVLLALIVQPWRRRDAARDPPAAR